MSTARGTSVNGLCCDGTLEPVCSQASTLIRKRDRLRRSVTGEGAARPRGIVSHFRIWLLTKTLSD